MNYDKRFYQDTLGWGFILWLIGYALGVLQTPLKFRGDTLTFGGVLGQKGRTLYAGRLQLDQQVAHPADGGQPDDRAQAPDHAAVGPLHEVEVHACRGHPRCGDHLVERP